MKIKELFCLHILFKPNFHFTLQALNSMESFPTTLVLSFCPPNMYESSPMYTKTFPTGWIDLCVNLRNALCVFFHSERNMKSLLVNTSY